MNYDKMQNLDPFQLPLAKDSGPPQADPTGQAVSALQGYAYQIWVTALAWTRLKPSERIYLEVAEDFALLAEGKIEATQVKHSTTSRTVTLNDRDIKTTIVSFINLQQRNPSDDVYVRFFTTKPIGIEKNGRKFFGEENGLEYWNEAAKGKKKITPVREYLKGIQFTEVKEFIRALSDDELRDKLISRIRWECGQHSIQGIEDDLIRYLQNEGSERYQFYPNRAAEVADALCIHILKTSIKEPDNLRILTSSDLESTIRSVTMVRISEVVLNNLLNQALAFQDILLGRKISDVRLTKAHRKWLYKGSDLPQTRGMIVREGIERKLKSAINQVGVAVLTGSTGIGKSIASRSFAQSQHDEFYIVECHDDRLPNVRYILEKVAEKATDIKGYLLILENFNAIENPDLQLLLEDVITRLRKSNVTVLITCHVQPSLTTLTCLGIDKQSVVECSGFSMDDVKSLIQAHSGDAEEWGTLIYARSGSGHPTIVHGLIKSLASRNWPDNEKTLSTSLGHSARDIESELASIRQRIVSELPPAERNLLYRLSLVTGSFDRHLALSLSRIDPALTRAGECIDQLTGPWIEKLSDSRYRVSSLVSGLGKEMFLEEELRRIHGCIVDEFVREEAIDVWDTDRILLHAIQAEMPDILFSMARQVLVSTPDMIRILARASTLVRWRTNKPIFEKDLFVSVYLRLAQFKLAEATGDHDKIRKVINVLCNEIELIPSGLNKKRLWTYVIVSIVQSPGIAHILDNWLSLLLRLIDISRTLRFWEEDFDGMETAPIEPTWDGFSVIFHGGILDIRSVSQFETIVDQLCKIPSESRSLLIQPVDESSSDYFELARHAWLQDRKKPDYDAEDAFHRYGRIAEKTSKWAERTFSFQAYAVQAAILDHDLGNPSHGLKIIENAAKIHGNDPILFHSMGQMCLSKQDYEQAFTIYKWLVENPHTSNPSRKAHTFREAARSAVHCDNLDLAEKWFMAAADIAHNDDSEDLNVLALGLKTDAALVALSLGGISRALTRLEEVVEILTHLDPDSTLRTGYTHAVIRHVIFNIKSRLCDDTDSRGLQLTGIEPGICSIPEPSDAIRQHPLGHIDYLWYMLSEIEFVSRINVGIYQSLSQRMPLGPIGHYEIYLRITAMRCRIEDLDAIGVGNCLEPYLEAAVYGLTNSTLTEGKNEAFSPTRGKIPTIIQDYHQSPQAVNAIKDVIVVFLMRSVMAENSSSVKDLKDTLTTRFGKKFPCMDLLENATGMPPITNNLECLIAEVIYQYFNQKKDLVPRDIWIMGMYFFRWNTVSTFRDSILKELVKWLQLHWRRIINERKVYLKNPLHTVPALERILDDTQSDLEFTARLLLVASEAVGIELSSDNKQFLSKFIPER